MKDEKFFQQYRSKIREYLNQSYARCVTEEIVTSPSRTWYIPHHATERKFRIVFDCAARYKGTSLNEELLQGPDQTSSLVGVILRFNLHRPIANVH